MKNVNQLVLNAQTEGNEGMAFFELFDIVNKETIEPKSQGFTRQLKGDTAEAHHKGYVLLIKLVAEWDGTGNFHTLFKKSFTNEILNLIKFNMRNKRRHNTSYQLSLSESETNGGETSPILETLNDASLVSYNAEEEEGLTLNDMIQKFSVDNPEKAGLIEIMALFTPETPQPEKTSAYCEYYGVQKYTGDIQKRVSRARESFYKFLVKNDFQLSF